MPQNGLGYSFAPSLDNAEQARTQQSVNAPQGSIQTLNFKLPTNPQGSISPLAGQDYAGGVNNAVLEAALRHVFGPGGIQGFLTNRQGPGQPQTPQGQPAQPGYVMPQGVQYEGQSDVPNFNLLDLMQQFGPDAGSTGRNPFEDPMLIQAYNDYVNGTPSRKPSAPAPVIHIGEGQRPSDNRA